MKYLFYISFVLAFVIVFYLNVTLFISPFLNSGDNQNLYFENKLESLKQEMHLGIAKDMQQLFPEGFCFTNLLYGLSIVELINQSNNQNNIRYWQKEVKWSIEQLESSYATQQFDKELHPTYGAFYHSWHTWLLGKFISTFPDGEADSLLYSKFDKNCEQIVNNYLIKGNCYPDSYKGQSFPGDVIVGIAALKLSDKISNKNYDDFINSWLRTVKAQINGTAKLIPHSIQNDLVEKARGSSQSLTLRYLFDIDSTFAEQQYQIYKSNFVESFLSFSLFREYKEGDKPIEDIDSGPVIWGFGSVASIVGIGTAKFFNDSNLYSDLNIIIEVLNPAIGFCGDDIVISDLFILWSRISNPISDVRENHNLLHIGRIKYISLAIFILFIFAMLYLIFRKKGLR